MNFLNLNFGGLKMGKQMKIGEWLDVWFDVYAKPEYAENTVKLYEDARRRLKRNSPDIENRDSLGSNIFHQLQHLSHHFRIDAVLAVVSNCCPPL